jgi:hypothetical protein
MEGKRMEFNDKDYRILKCAQPNAMGYINDDRALELMKLGYLENNPKENWSNNGYKATRKGVIIFNKWIKDMRLSHGHIWMTYEDYCKKEGLHDKGDKYSKKEKTEPCSYAYSEGYHNGYKCKECGFEFCHHCNNEFDIPKCSKKSKNVTMSDDSKLDAEFVAMDKAIRSSF